MPIILIKLSNIDSVLILRKIIMMNGKYKSNQKNRNVIVMYPIRSFLLPEAIITKISNIMA